MFYLTTKTEKELKEKVKFLEEKIHEAEIETAKAAEHGTWHDNFGFEQSQQKREFYVIQAQDIKARLKNAAIIQPNTDPSKIGLGHKVTLDTNNGTKIFTIVGELDTNLERGFISFNSPLGKQLLDKTIGSQTDQGWEIKSIEPAEL